MLRQFPPGSAARDLVRNPVRGTQVGTLVLVHDMSFVERRSEDTRSYLFGFFILLGVVVALITVVIAQLSWRGWVAGVRALLRGEGSSSRSPAGEPGAAAARGRPARAAARPRREPAREERGAVWNPEPLRAVLRNELRGDEVIVVSNREPYIHVHHGRRHRDAASGERPGDRARAGDARLLRHLDRARQRLGRPATVDAKDRIAVPPDKPATRCAASGSPRKRSTATTTASPTKACGRSATSRTCGRMFRTGDWEQYAHVNQRFADAVVAEAKSDDPIVLVQDYHFALLPRLIRERLPPATIITFWHIPWPNPESFGICPWREELLDGLLGSTILGFHTQFHCNNFLDTVDRYLEARIGTRTSTISYGGHRTSGRALPDLDRVAVAVGRSAADGRRVPSARRSSAQRFPRGRPARRRRRPARLHQGHPRALPRGRAPARAAAGVDRPVHVRADRRADRAALDEYRNFEDEVHALAAAHQRALRRGRPCRRHPARPSTTSPKLINEYYRAADVCVVTSLHDGMNLVAKEFVAARDDEQGVLILSQFTGAARELAEALLVNPYHVEQCAEALDRALRMPPDEQRERMRSMRRLRAGVQRLPLGRPMLLDAAGCASASASSSASKSTASGRWKSVDLRVFSRRRIVPGGRARSRHIAGIRHRWHARTDRRASGPGAVAGRSAKLPRLPRAAVKGGGHHRPVH